jgi:hypothetical protein
MRVIFQVTAGPSSGRQIPLQAGEIARFGSSDSADVCIAGDDLLSAVHFEVDCRSDQCRVRDLHGQGGTLLNDEPLTESSLSSGDVVRAGQTSFLANLEGAFESGPAESVDGAPEEEKSIIETRSLADICADLGLDEESIALLTPDHTPPAFVETLLEHDQFADAIRVLSAHLPKRDAIHWAYQCVQELLGDKLSANETAALGAALAWIEDPSEENRRHAMKAAESTEFLTPPGWVAAAVFWSEGSIAPPDLPEVAPDELLTNQAVTASLMLAATQGDPATANDRYRKFLETGQAVFAGELPAPV